MVYEVEMWAFCNGAVRQVDIKLTKEHWDTETEECVLSEIYFWGQNDFQPQNMPSVSVGDVARLGLDRWLCCQTGWKKLTTEEYISYTEMPRTERIFSSYRHQ